MRYFFSNVIRVVLTNNFKDLGTSCTSIHNKLLRGLRSFGESIWELKLSSFGPIYWAFCLQ